MYLDTRSEGILQQLIHHSNIDNQKILKKFSISRNQLNYSMKKINQWCKENNHPQIKRLKNGHFYVPAELIHSLKTDDNEDSDKVLETYISSEKERINLILLMLFSKQDYLSLDHFMIDLGISKNTAMRAMNKLRNELPESLDISYSRNKGYELVGNEWDIRKQIIKTVTTIKKMINGGHFLRKYINISEESIQENREILENAEKLLNVKFTDDRIEMLPYVFAIISHRINQGYIIQQSFHIQNNMLSDTNEYRVASKVFDNWSEITDQEKLFITLQLLTTNIFSGDILTENLAKELDAVVDKCLYQFERRACVTLEQREALKERLLLHLKPAYYRIKYHMNLTKKLDDLMFNKKYHALKHIIRETFQPLQDFIGEMIPDEEFEFIALFVLSGLSDVSSEQREKQRAIVVCKSGVLISQTLTALLQKTFLELDFLPTCSLRDFSKVKDDVDIVFSTVPITDFKQNYLVKPIMSQYDLENLKRQVSNDNSGIRYTKSEQFTLEDLLQVIESNAEIKNKDELEKSLINLIFAGEAPNVKRKEKNQLHHLLKENHIQIVNRVLNYQEAINLASQPLVAGDYITENYVRQMIENHDFEDPYIVLGDKVAIPHAIPEAGVHKLGISLLYVRNGVYFAETNKVYFIFVIAPVDQEQHIESLYKIMNIAENEILLDEMQGAANRKGLHQIIIQ